MATEFNLSLVIRAVDKATEPLRAINKRMAQFTAPVRKLGDSLRALGDEAGVTRLAKTFGGVGSAVKKAGNEAWSLGLKLAGLATAGAVGLYALVRSSVDAGDQLSEMAQRVGLSVDAYAQLQFAAAQADVEQEAFNGAMDQFNKRLGMAKAGGGELLSFLEKVSPKLALQVKGAKSTDEALRLMAGAFQKVTDPGKRAALASAAFGRSGLQMGQFLGQGSEAIEKQRRRFLELAGSQQAFADGASAVDNALRETGVAFEGVRNAAMGALFPVIAKLAEALSNFMAQHRDAIVAWAERAAAAITAWVSGGGVDRLIATLGNWASTIGTVVSALGGLGGVLKIIGAYMVGSFAVSVASLGQALGAFGMEAVKLGIRLVAALLPGIISATAAMWGFTVAMLANPITWIVLGVVALAAAVYLIYKNWGPIKKFFGRIWDGIVEAVKGAWSHIKEFFAHMWDAIVSGLTSLYDTYIKPIIDTIIKALQWMGILEKNGPDAVQNATGGAVTVGGAGTLGADGAAPGRGPGFTSEARFKVDFANMPKGVRVTQEPGSNGNVDMNVGYALAPGS